MPHEWTDRQVTDFQKAVIQWFEEAGRHDLPWRQTRDPYAVMVSELMLQQTQVATVLKKGFFENWMEKFPDVRALANAGEDEILKAWEGLGYYNRARNLQKAAQFIQNERGGDFPTDLESILKLPGVGRYTAGAVYSCAFEKSAPVVDGNVIRIFSRLFGIIDAVDTTATLRKMWDLAESLVPKIDARAFNSGLMEIGQRICRKSKPNCEICPLRAHCKGFKTGMELETLPVKANRQKLEAKGEKVLFCRDNDKILLACGEGSRRRGLWKLPEIDSEKAKSLPEILRISYGITKYKVEMKVFRGNLEDAAELSEKTKWFAVPGETDDCAIASPYRKALERLIENEFQDLKWQFGQ